MKANLKKYEVAIEVVTDLRNRCIFSMDAGSEVLDILEAEQDKAKRLLSTIIGENADAHSCHANAEDGFCSICGRDVRPYGGENFGPCELGTCTCCQ